MISHTCTLVVVQWPASPWPRWIWSSTAEIPMHMHAIMATLHPKLRSDCKSESDPRVEEVQVKKFDGWVVMVTQGAEFSENLKKHSVSSVAQVWFGAVG